MIKLLPGFVREWLYLRAAARAMSDAIDRQGRLPLGQAKRLVNPIAKRFGCVQEWDHEITQP